MAGLVDQKFKKYLIYLLLLRRIYLTAKISWRITRVDLRQLARNCQLFVQQWQEYYYGGEDIRLKNLKINLHALLHLGAHSSLIGPLNTDFLQPNRSNCQAQAEHDGRSR
jgi:hypothetical protein